MFILSVLFIIYLAFTYLINNKLTIKSILCFVITILSPFVLPIFSFSLEITQTNPELAYRTLSFGFAGILIFILLPFAWLLNEYKHKIRKYAGLILLIPCWYLLVYGDAYVNAQSAQQEFDRNITSYIVNDLNRLHLTKK